MVGSVRVAAFQAPLEPAGTADRLGLLRRQVRRCEALDVGILVFPEAVLGGLADDVATPSEIAIRPDDLPRVLEPLASDQVAVVVGFTEAHDGRFYNAAAILCEGRIVGIYRKRHPARRASIYAPGSDSPLFDVRGVRLGLMICNDTNDPHLANDMAARGAQLFLVPSHNGLRPAIADVVAETRAVDVETARRCGVPVVRADVAGRSDEWIAFGTSAIIDGSGTLLVAGQPFAEDLLVADLRP